jgi:ubiquinone biosynthesis protein
MSRGERRQNLARLREIGQVAARHGFGYLFRRGGGTPDEDGVVARRTRGVRLREMLEELGPTFVKFGQIMSTRPDIVPDDVIVELRKLTDSARPVPFDQVRVVIEEELGLTVEQAFERLDPDPIGAASIGQVHTARLPGGREVVVKVQRPDAERQLTADIQLLYQVARIIKERVRRLDFIDPVGLVDEFARTVRQELDYRVEARNADAMRRFFLEDPKVAVPTVYWRQTTGRLLVMERLEGTALARTDLSGWTMEERRTLAGLIAEAWMQQIFVFGLFHADPHPANIMVAGPDRIGLVDFGMVGQLTTRDREAAVKLFVDILDNDMDRIPRHLRDLGVRYPADLEEEFREQLGVMIQRYHGATMGEIDAREVLKEIFAIIYRLDIQLPARWVMLDKALATLAGVGLEISPSFNVFETARPYARKLLIDRVRPDKVAARLQGDIARYTQTFLEYPFQVSELLEEFKDGEVRITIDLAEFRDASEKGVAAANRLSIAVFAAGVTLASALVGTMVEDGPHLFGLALVGVPGFVVGVGLFIWIALGVIRSGRW